MSNTQPPKLTKKQKKGIAFRERKQGKGKSKHVDREDAGLQVPVEENLDSAEIEDNYVEAEKVVSSEPSRGSSRRNGDEKADHSGGGRGTRVVGEKRKREEEGEEDQKESNKPEQKKRKGGNGDEKVGEKEEKSQGKQRFILFVGNLKYTTSLEAIKEHFAACDPPPTIRLLTPKRSVPGKPTAKSRGCAFLEFSHRNALQQALKLHQSEIEGRRINVELTAGGGGKSESRLSKVKQRNRDLDEQRKKRSEKQATSGKSDEQVSILPERPQRFSTTSGGDQAAAGKRTWTVGDEEDGKTHRGGRKHSKAGKKARKGKEWGTGVNAIPVG